MVSGRKGQPRLKHTAAGSPGQPHTSTPSAPSPSPVFKPAGKQEVGADTADLEGMLAESLKHARADVKRFLRETQQAGWDTHPLMLSQTERATFALVS